MSQNLNRPGPGDLISHAFELFNARGADYDNAHGMEQNMREIAAVASLVIGKDLTARDVTLIHLCTKLIRSKSVPGKLDNYVDGMNYLAFAACCTGLAPLPNVVKQQAGAVAPTQLREVTTHTPL